MAFIKNIDGSLRSTFKIGKGDLDTLGDPTIAIRASSSGIAEIHNAGRNWIPIASEKTNVTHSLGVSGAYLGTTIDLSVTSEDVVLGNALYINSSSQAIRSTNVTPSTMPCTIMALANGDGTKPCLLNGYLRNDDWSWTSGGLLYVGIDGAITQTIPSAGGSVIQVIGYAVTNTIICFRPSLVTVELAST